MKKLTLGVFSLLMAAVLLAGCGGGASSSVAQPAGDSSAASSEVVSSQTPQSVADSSVPDDSGEPLVRGTWDGDTYSNEHFGVSFTLPADWVAGTEADLAAMMNISVDLLEGSEEEYPTELLEQATIFDMMATGDGVGNVMVMLENLSVYPLGILMSADNYIESLKQNLETNYAGQVEIGDSYQDTLGAHDYTVVPVTYTQAGTEQYMYVRKQSSYIVVVAITTVTGGTPLSDITPNFA